MWKSFYSGETALIALPFNPVQRLWCIAQVCIRYNSFMSVGFTFLVVGLVIFREDCNYCVVAWVRGFLDCFFFLCGEN